MSEFSDSIIIYMQIENFRDFCELHDAILDFYPIELNDKIISAH